MDEQPESQQDLDDIDALVDSIKTFDYPTPNTDKAIATRNSKPIAEHDLNTYILNKAKDLIEVGVTAIEDLRPFIIQGQSPEEIAALAELINSTTRSIEILNKINLQDKKAVSDEKLKNVEIAARKEIAAMLPATQHQTTNNVIVATREEILKKLFDTEKDITPHNTVEVQTHQERLDEV